MNKLKTFWTRLRSLWQQPALKQEIDEELRFHIEQRTGENIAAGMSPEEAAREARKRFGNFQTVREECRKTIGASFGEATLQDVRFGLRILRKSPGFTSVAVLSLALGLGINLMLFSIFNAVFLRPVPGVQDPTHLVYFKGTDRSGNPAGFPYSDYEEYRDRNRVFSGLFAWLDRDAGGETTTLGNGPEDRSHASGELNPEEIPTLLVSDDYFSTLGVHTVLGRTFLPEETKTPGSHPVVVLSHRLWQRRFSSDPGVLGRIVTLNGVAFTVVGVAPAEFLGFGDLRATDAWVPLMMMAQLNPRGNSDYGARLFQMAGRLKPGVTVKEAQAALQVLHAQLAQPDLPPENRPSLRLQAAGTFAPLAESIGLVLPVMIAVSLVLVIACANAANLLLVRAVARRREMGIRFAVGADRARIIRQMLTESVLIALMAGALGLLLGFWCCTFAWAFIQQSLPGLTRYIVALDLSPDLRTVGYALLLSLLTALVFGLAPAFAASRVNPNAAMKDEGSMSGPGFSRSWLRNFLVITQVAACLSLLIGVGQLLTAGRKASNVKLGYEARDVVLAELDLFRHRYPDARTAAFQGQLLEGLRVLPGVKHVSLARDTLARNRHVDCVSPDYFDTMAIPLLQGRQFTEQDISSGARVAIVSQATAQRLWPGKDPIGERLTNAPFAEIVGVVGNVRNLREFLFNQPCSAPELAGGGHEDYLYLPASANHCDLTHLAVLLKAPGDPKPVMAAIRDEVRKLDPSVLVSVGALTQDMQDNLKFFGILGTIANLIGLTALLLSAIGVFGVVACSVSQHTREIGIRMALGAQSGDVMRLEMRRGIWLVVGGLALGLPGAFGVSRVLASALIDLHSFDPLTFLFASLGLGVVMMLACWLPARRAAKVDPMVALRHE